MRIAAALIAVAVAAPAAAQQPAAPAKPAKPAAAASAAAPAAAATPSPRAPRETITAPLEGKKVAIEYGRPALKGRSVAELLARLPEDRVWRAGVDMATTLTTDADIMVGSTRVPKGKYTVYLYAPATGDYSLILNSDLGVPLKQIYAAAGPDVADALWPRPSYEEIKAKEVARVPLMATKPAEAMEMFKISMEPAVDGVSALRLAWGDQAWMTGVKIAPPK